jgi:anaerobic magnesium-protoporphyrin IX monomethyl ester cyclase
MKILLMSMPDVAPIIMHASAFHMPNLGIASIGANIDPLHEVYIIDLIRKRRHPGRAVVEALKRLSPQVVGLSAMTWQYGTSVRIARRIKALYPGIQVVLGGYHATLMAKEIGESKEAKWFDYLVRGEGEATFNQLVNALGDPEAVSRIPSLSYKKEGKFIHNPMGSLLDLSTLKLPIRDRRRLTWGYHIMNRSIEVMESSRGCTRNCNFCSIRHMYGRKFRPFPIERILADIDDIYFHRKCRRIFVSDDNMVLSPKRVIELCRAIIDRNYRGLLFTVQADCVTMAENEEMVATMARAGFRCVFLGIESVSGKNLETAQKGDIVAASRRAVALCHRYGIMVVGGMIFGFPDDNEKDIIENYRFLKSIEADTAYCQILTPYPKTGIRDHLLRQGLVTNPNDFTRYNGMWANVRTRHLSDKSLHYLYWFHKQSVLGWWEPSLRVRRQGKIWTGIWVHLFKPVLKAMVDHSLRNHDWRGRYEKALKQMAEVNRFPDLDP